MKASYRLFPLVKKGSPISDPCQVPQHSGTPGWIYLTHTEDGEAKVYFTDTKGDKPEYLSIVIDERICCDTIFRAVRISPKIYIVYDVFVLNGTRIHETLTFSQRQEKIAELLELFHFPDLVALVTIENAPVGTHIRGQEQYDNVPGTIGVYLPVVE